ATLTAPYRRCLPRPEALPRPAAIGGAEGPLRRVQQQRATQVGGEGVYAQGHGWGGRKPGDAGESGGGLLGGAARHGGPVPGFAAVGGGVEAGGRGGGEQGLPAPGQPGYLVA